MASVIEQPAQEYFLDSSCQVQRCLKRCLKQVMNCYTEAGAFVPRRLMLAE